ncbi:hypothetical protein ACFX2I_030843 [Malus domestica]
MYLAATYLSNGSEMLLEILGPGIIGGLFLPILGALPDAMLILVSGLSGTKETAQSQVSVGMGLLAGSTVMLLTVIWGSCVIVGKCDIEGSVAIDNKDTKGLSLTGSGVSTDIWTSYAATIMIVSVIPFLIVQLPQLLNSTSGRHLAVLISLIVSVALLLSYCLYQVFQPWIQRRKIAYAKHKHVISGLLQHLKKRALGKLLNDEGEPDANIIEKLFCTIDGDSDRFLSGSELRALIVGIRFDEIQLDNNEAVEKVMSDFDTSHDSRISSHEFFIGISKWLNEAKRQGDISTDPSNRTMKILTDFHKRTKEEHALLRADDQSDEVVEGVENVKWTSIKAGLMLLVGTLIAAAFADPLVDAVDNFSDATSIPTFFISFIALPLATNSSEAVSAIIFASRKKIRTASLTFSELYGAVTMNNLLCLAVFLALVYARGLTWDFSSEVLVILIVCVVMGLLGSLRTVFPLWTCSIAYLLYPFSLALIIIKLGLQSEEPKNFELQELQHPPEKTMSNTLLFHRFFFFLILCGGAAAGRNISRPQSSPHDVNVSDGVHRRSNNSTVPYLTLNRPGDIAAEVEGECEETYGFLPCTDSVLGNLFLILVYGYLMYLAATYLSNGSELLLEILGPGIVGGLFLPVLGSLPDAILILVSGLSGSKETAQSQVSVGMGLLAGSTVLILTLIWGSCVVVGKCDIRNSVAIDNKDTKGFSLTGSGVSTDIWTSYAARIMTISILPFIIVQLPAVINSKSGSQIAVLVALVISVALFISYCLYQVFQPWIQRRRIAYAKHKHVISGILQHLKMRFGSLLTDDGEPNEENIIKLFYAMDQNGDGHISGNELRAMIVGLKFDEIELDKNDAVEKVMNDFDTSHDSQIDKNEFLFGISKWIHEAKRSGDDNDHRTMKFLFDFHSKTKQEHDLLGGQSDEIIEGVENPKWTSFKAVLMLLIGTLIAAAAADPLIDVVDNFSTATGIPTFFISFIALPLATSCEAVSAIMFASRKKIRTASLTFSQLYGSATMNNVMCLSVFLALVYFRELTWDFSAEVLIILIVCIVMGVFCSFRTVFPLWTSSIAFLLYPFSIALIYVLDYILGWS